MKLICIEEHVVDADLGKAVYPALQAEAGYMADWESRVTDVPVDNGRPSLLSFKDSLALARDTGAGRLANMDDHGIDMQVLSCSTAAQLAPAEVAVELTRAANDKMASAIRANPTRLSGFAALPWQNPQAAAQELERCVEELGFVGALLQGRPGVTFLDDERYAPVLAKLHELEVPLYLHPGFPLPQVQEPYYGGLDKEISARLSLFGWGWHNEAGIQVIRMMLSGQFEKFPNLQVISGHWGEMVPFFLQRLDDTIPLAASRLSKTITETYKQHVYVTPSGMLDLPHFEFTLKVLGIDRMLYSIDYPYVTLNGSRAFLESLPVSEADKEKFAHGNAEKLFRW